jgi:hypothetical protein
MQNQSINQVYDERIKKKLIIYKKNIRNKNVFD